MQVSIFKYINGPTLLNDHDALVYILIILFNNIYIYYSHEINNQPFFYFYEKNNLSSATIIFDYLVPIGIKVI